MRITLFQNRTCFRFQWLLALLFFVRGMQVFAGSGTTDSSEVKGIVAPLQLVPKSVVQSMNREQLSSLVDFLFEMDTIPTDLIEELKIAVANLEKAESSLPERPHDGIPSSDLYSSWENYHLFPAEDLLKFKGDTSITLQLNSKNENPYFHPCNGPVTSNFGWRDSTQHNGIDIDLNKGDKVYAAFDGMVRVAMRYGGFGNVVIIRHYNGLETVYGHLSKIKVKPGQEIHAGQVLGLGGSTGHSTGSHLHFEVRFKGVPINPKYLISFTDHTLYCDELTIKKTRWGMAAFPANRKRYTVERGDTVFEVAKRFGTTTAMIRQLNNLPARGRLKPGQQINVSQ